jgi:hypothetical protein
VAAKVRQIGFSPDEYLAGTMGMTHAERGLYWQVCTVIYSSGRGIHESDERLFRSSPDNPRTTRALLENLIRRGKIERSSDGELMVKRCRKELESAANRMRTASENGSKGGRPRKTFAEDQGDVEPEALSAEKLSSPSSPPSSPEEAIASSRGRKRASRISPDWLPSEEDEQHARDKGLDDRVIREEAEHFRNHFLGAHGKGAVSPDWSAKWRTWIAKHLAWQGEGSRRTDGRRPTGSNRQTPTSAVSIGRSLLDEVEAGVSRGGR